MKKKYTFKQCYVQNDTRNLKNVKYKRDHMRHGTLPLILSNPSGIDRVRLNPPRSCRQVTCTDLGPVLHSCFNIYRKTYLFID